MRTLDAKVVEQARHVIDEVVEGERPSSSSLEP
jgi:hypothetical protein